MKIEIENNVVKIVGATDEEFFEVVRFVRNLAAGKSPSLPPAEVKTVMQEINAPAPEPEPAPRTPPKRRGAQVEIAGNDDFDKKVFGLIKAEGPIGMQPLREKLGASKEEVAAAIGRLGDDISKTGQKAGVKYSIAK